MYELGSYYELGMIDLPILHSFPPLPEVSSAVWPISSIASICSIHPQAV